MSQSVEQAKPSSDDAPIHVLLIEDNAGFAFFIRDVLVRQKKGGFSVDTAGTLADGLAILRKGGTDVVLLDLGLPDSIRSATFARVRSLAGDTPIIVLTVLEDDEVALKTVRAGAQDYLVKDQVEKNLLVRSIRYAVERARIERALHQLSGRLLESQDQERRRIARDLHDVAAQNLAALAMNLSLLKSFAEHMPPEGRALLDESLASAKACGTELRTVSYLLHPPLLDELGLAGAVREYADGFAERSGIRVDLEIPSDFGRLSADCETALFRVLQESLANIHRHSASPTASIRFACTPSEVLLEVADRGKGLKAGSLASGDASLRMGVGIAGMRERIRQLGGRLEILTGAQGTTVTASLPHREPPA